jgi:hypothetical protein
MKKMLKTLTVVAMFLAIAAPALMSAMPVHAIGVNDLTGGYDVSAGLNNTDPRTIASNIIKIALGFLGILAVVIILIGGFKWVTAAGNEDSIADAKKILVAGVIGLVIILASWGIANFVLTSLVNNI